MSDAYIHCIKYVLATCNLNLLLAAIYTLKEANLHEVLMQQVARRPLCELYIIIQYISHIFTAATMSCIYL